MQSRGVVANHNGLWREFARVRGLGAITVRLLGDVRRMPEVSH